MLPQTHTDHCLYCCTAGHALHLGHLVLLYCPTCTAAGTSWTFTKQGACRT